MDLDALFRMPMTSRPGNGGVRPFACAASAESPLQGRRIQVQGNAFRMGGKPGATLAAGR